jgi:hypothetical protein
MRETKRATESEERAAEAHRGIEILMPVDFTRTTYGSACRSTGRAQEMERPLHLSGERRPDFDSDLKGVGEIIGM